MTPEKLILEELKNSGKPMIEWKGPMAIPNDAFGMRELRNASNGAVDSSTLGYDYAIQTTTLIRAKTVAQKFYEIPFASYIPVIPGEAAWMESIKTNVVYSIGGSFDQGIVINGANEQKFAQLNTGTTAVSQSVALWAKSYNYNTFEVNKALALNNWDVISSKMYAMKKEWDLGIQKTSFLGLRKDLTNFPGLLSQSSVNVNLTAITKNISAFSYTEFQTFVSVIMAAYFSNSNSTALPTHFAIPQDDYLGLSVFINPQYPTADAIMLTVLEKAFKLFCGPSFTIYGVAYAQIANNAGYWDPSGTQRYCLYRKDPDTFRMDLPMDFILAAPVPTGSVTFEGVGYGQFTGVVVFRPAEFLYFDHT